jgi:hypothetical protein
MNCPEGAICKAKGLVVSQLALHPGQWRAFSNSTDVYSCPIFDACLGGLSVCNTSESILDCKVACAKGYRGPKCGVCQLVPRRFGKGSKSCVDCLSQRGLHQFLVAMLPVLIVAIVALLTRMQVGRSATDSGSKGTDNR